MAVVQDVVVVVYVGVVVVSCTVRGIQKVFSLFCWSPILDVDVLEDVVLVHMYVWRHDSCVRDMTQET